MYTFSIVALSVKSLKLLYNNILHQKYPINSFIAFLGTRCALIKTLQLQYSDNGSLWSRFHHNTLRLTNSWVAVESQHIASYPTTQCDWSMVSYEYDCLFVCNDDALAFIHVLVLIPIASVYHLSRTSAISP